jgi:IS5 family transposase
MIQKSDSQRTFIDTDYICERLVPQDSFYRKFKELVSPLIKDEAFDSMYCQDNGRPPISPSLMAMACILQFYRGLSDREMEEACMYDIQIKFALGLGIDDRPFDHSSLFDFRERLLKNGKEKQIFDRILDHLISKRLIKRDEIQRIDATHVIADIAIPTMVTFIKKAVYEILKTLKCRHKAVYYDIAKEIDMTEYSQEEVNHDAPGRLDIEKRRKKLVEVVADAKIVLKHLKRLKPARDLKKKENMLRRILRENIETDNKGKPDEKEFADKPKDILVSPVDPDARHGAKSKTKKFVGYKANVTETVKSRFITNIKAMPGNAHDGSNAVAMVTDQTEHKLKPKKLIGDTAYGSGRNRIELKEIGTKVVAPNFDRNARGRDIFPKGMFMYDNDDETLTCPMNVTVDMKYHDYTHDALMFVFPAGECRKCKVRKQCTNCKGGYRTVGISTWHEELLRAEKHNQTQTFKKEMKLRPGIEGKLSELKRYHGMRRARYRGLKKVGLQFYLTAAAVNIKRWVKVILEKMRRKRPAWAT